MMEDHRPKQPNQNLSDPWGAKPFGGAPNSSLDEERAIACVGCGLRREGKAAGERTRTRRHGTACGTQAHSLRQERLAPPSPPVVRPARRVRLDRNKASFEVRRWGRSPGRGSHRERSGRPGSLEVACATGHPIIRSGATRIDRIFPCAGRADGQHGESVQPSTASAPRRLFLMPTWLTTRKKL